MQHAVTAAASTAGGAVLRGSGSQLTSPISYSAEDARPCPQRSGGIGDTGENHTIEPPPRILSRNPRDTDTASKPAAAPRRRADARPTAIAPPSRHARPTPRNSP